MDMPTTSASEKVSSQPDKRQWFVRMSNGSTFGPIHTRGLLLWAQEGRIMPDDEVSEDRKSWLPAQQVQELGMDTLIERADGTFSGPFHPDAIQPLIAEGKIPPNAGTFHRDELPAMLAARQMALFSEPSAASPPTASEETPPASAAETVVKTAKAKERDGERIALRRTNQRLSERVCELEKALEELRSQTEHARTEPGRVTELENTLEELRTQTEAERERNRREREELQASLQQQTDAREALMADLESAGIRGRQLEVELAQSRSDYRELLEFANTRDTEYAVRLEAAERNKANSGDSSAGSGGSTAEIRRVHLLEEQLAGARKEQEELRQLLEKAQADSARQARPQEAEIARIQAFAESAVVALQKTLEQDREAGEKARMAGAARQEALTSQLQQLQRAINLAPGEATRSEQMERHNDRLIVKLKQELEAGRRQHQTELHQASERLRELEQRASAIEKREAAARDQLARSEARAADYDSVESQLRRRESALLTVEREFETARQQWQSIEMALMQRIEELERAASPLLSDMEAPGRGGSPRPSAFQARPWMKLQR